MLADNLTTASFSAAIQRTFDGKHPCPLCKAVAQGRKSEKKSETLVPIGKFEGISAPVALVLSPPAPFPAIEARHPVFKTLPHAPPTPPPRAA
jgi:hypothetical protein